MLKVTDTTTGRTGRLVERPGYVLNGSYVNPHHVIVWDSDEDDEDETTTTTRKRKTR